MSELRFEPHNAPCYNFLLDGVESKKTAWLSPIVIKHERTRTLVSWSCNWGHLCEAGCLYAHGFGKTHPIASSFVAEP